MLRIVGDVHGKIDKYVDLVKDCDYSLQLGDMGFSYAGLYELDKTRHKFFGGNHDNYDVYYKCPYALKDYGTYSLGGVEFFYIRGAFSIDHIIRVQHEMLGYGRSFWKEEQLDYKTMDAAIKLYKKVKPKVMITHTCPGIIAKLIGNPKVLRNYHYDPDTFTTGTQEALQECFDAHAPEAWFYGHFHQDRIDVLNGTVFTCLNELSFIDLD